jgi:cytochrome c
MHEADINRIALTALGSILFAMLLVAFSNLVFEPGRPAVPGYALPTSAAPSEAPVAAAAAPAEPLPVLLASADPKKGAQDAKVCTTCHNFDKGAPAKVGPPLWGVVGRPIASVPGFAYSDSLKGVGGDWTYEAINKMITNPKSEAAGTKMAYPGESDPHKRADILAYLQTLSDSPVPFPKEASAK